MDTGDSDRRRSDDHSPKAEFNILMVSDSIKKERGTYTMADQCSEEVNNAFCPAEEESNIMMASDSIKEETGVYPITGQCAEEVRNNLCPTEEEFNLVIDSDSIKEEKEACPMADQSSEEVKNAFCPAEEEFNMVMDSGSIKEEREDYPMADQSSEEVKNAFCPAEEEFNLMMGSDSIKEEREAHPMTDQGSEEVKNALCPAGLAGITSLSSDFKEEQEASSVAHQNKEIKGCVNDFIGLTMLVPDTQRPLERTCWVVSGVALQSGAEYNIVMDSDRIQEERGVYTMVDQCSQEVKNAFCSAEEESNIMMVSDSIKEEIGVSPITGQCSEEVRNNVCPAGMAGITSLSSNFKEEEEASSMAHQINEIKRSVNNCIGTFIGRRPETMNAVDQLLAQPFLGLSLENKLIVKRLGPHRPDLQLQQTTLDRGKTSTRTFTNSWYKKADWLAGSTSKNSLFCFPCLLYGGDGQWTKNGVTDLRHLSDKIKKHAHSGIHMKNLTRLGMLRDIPIVAHISDAYGQGIKNHNEAVDRNRHILSKIIDCIRFCGAFELALRGHDESESSSNPGIFRGLVDLIASIDTEMEADLASATVFKGTSKTILNELLECMLEIIRSSIVQQLKNTDFVAIQVDDTTDVATKTQSVLIFRYIDNDSKVVERFYGFTQLRDSSAETIATDLLTQLNLILPEPPQKQNLIAQSYDGASVMSGIFGGVQKKIRDVYPNAHYVHCYAHQLNLIMQQAVAKISEAQIFFLDVEAMAAFFSCSPKRTEVLNDIVTTRLPEGSVTRWNFHIRTINLIYEYRVDLEKCFDTIEASTDFETKSRSEARGFARTLQDREFQFFLYLFHEIMPHVDTLYKELQKQEIDTMFVKGAINQFVTSMYKVRQTIDTLDSRLPKDSTFSNRRKKKSSLARTAKEICDTIIVHAKERFSFTKHLVSATLLQSDQFANYDISFPQQALCEAVEAYPMLIKEDLKAELSVLYGMHVYRQATGAISLLALIQKLNMEKSLTETVALLKILITTPMTTAESERCFSTLNRIKTFLRNTIIEERLNALAMLSIERDFVKRIPDFNVQVIEKFAAIKDRCADFMYKK